MDLLKDLNEQVVCVDSDDCLRVVNYTKCTNDSDGKLKHARGIVQEIESGNVLFETLPFTEEYSPSTVGEIDLNEWNVYHSIEGCLIRVFWYKTRWYVSTNKKLNAFQSRWSSRKSFGEMFQEGLVAISGNPNILETLLDSLDKSYAYFFLVAYNNENRVVCRAAKPKESVVFVCRSHLESKTFDHQWSHKPEIPTHTPVPTSDIHDLASFVDQLDIRQYQGLILFHKTENRQIKIIHPRYSELANIRNNNPNLRFRYLEVRSDDAQRKLLFDLYPSYQDMFLEYENILYQVAKMIKFYYIQRYIKNKYVTLPKEEYVLMKKCHDWYLLDREEHRISVASVLRLMNQEQPVLLYKIIRRYQINCAQQASPAPVVAVVPETD